MKRLIGVILCFSVLMIACNKKDFPKTMYVNLKDGLEVRNSPWWNAKIIGFLSYLTEVKITKEDKHIATINNKDGRFVYIKKPIKGWVFNRFLENIDSIMETNLKENTNDVNKTRYVNVTDGLWIRNSPSSNGEKIGSLEYHTEVKITKEYKNIVNIGGISGKWVYITEPIKGWVFNRFLDNYDQHINRTVTSQEQYIKEKLIGTWKIIEVSPYNENTDFFLSENLYFMDSMVDAPWAQNLFGGYNFQLNYVYGQWNWEQGKNRIKIEGGLPSETEIQLLANFGEYYLTDVNFIDNEHITLYNEIAFPWTIEKKVFLKLERIE
jgi:hypothetical protein